MPPNLGNTTYGHWRVKHKARTAYLTSCDWLLLAAGKTLPDAEFHVPPPPPAPYPSAIITAHLRLGAAMDEDNLFARIKWAQDWLKTRGYIADDRRTNLTWSGIPTQTISRKHVARLTITLTPHD